MKRILLLIFLVGFFAKISSQEYIPLLIDGNEWKVAYDGFYGCEFQYTECNYSLGNEIEINGLLYKELFIASETPNAINPHNCESISESPTLFLYLREDITEKKVYKMDLNAQNEYVFRNYSFEIGDVLEGNVEVVNRLSGTIFGTETRSLHLLITYDTYPFSAYTVIFEGIGSKNGLLETQWSDYIDGFSTLISFTKNGVTSTNNEFILTTEDYFTQNDIKLFYNKNDKNLQLTNTSNNLTIEIYSVLGKKIISRQVNNFLDVSQLQKGIYFYRLSKNNSIKKGKIFMY